MKRLKPKQELPSLRRALIRVHTDLLKVHYRVEPHLAYFPERLSTFERMVLTLEDRRFFDHSGFDIVAFFRVLWRFATFRPTGGASTIDMQFVRVATGRYERTIKRKIYEIFLAKIIQYRYSKIVILRSYLEIAYFGYRMTGHREASIRLFRIPSTELNCEQSSLLASQLVFPHPKKENEKWLRSRARRANYIGSVYIRRKEKLDKLERREML